MKKKLIIFTLILTLLLGSAQVYAATVLDTNLITLIMDGFSSLKNYLLPEIDHATGDQSQKYRDEAAQSVSGMADNAFNELENHKNKEIARSEQELNAYLEAVEAELKGVVDDQVTQIKGIITSKVNQSIENTKKQIDKEIEKQIKDKFKIK